MTQGRYGEVMSPWRATCLASVVLAMTFLAIGCTPDRGPDAGPIAATTRSPTATPPAPETRNDPRCPSAADPKAPTASPGSSRAAIRRCRDVRCLAAPPARRRRKPSFAPAEAMRASHGSWDWTTARTLPSIEAGRRWAVLAGECRRLPLQRRNQVRLLRSLHAPGMGRAARAYAVRRDVAPDDCQGRA